MKLKIVGYVALAFALWFVIKNPTGAAATTKQLGAGLSSVATSVGNYLTSLAGGGAR